MAPSSDPPPYTSSSSSDDFDVRKIREQFPALKDTDQIYMDNAGGSQVLGSVIESVTNYMSRTNVQLGASYKTSVQSTKLYEEGYKAAAAYINAEPQDIVIGSSTTQLLRNLSFAFTASRFPAASEIVISLIDHETNIDPWTDMAARLRLSIAWWKPDPTTLTLTPASLAPLLNPRTRLVACTHASNVLGTINPIRALADLIHSAAPEALFCVDGVAYAPHRPIDVQSLGVDYYAFSWYKVYGPHVSQLWGARRSHARRGDVHNLGHFFNFAADGNDSLAGRIGMAGTSYELLAGIPAAVRYLKGGDGSRGGFSWDAAAVHEEKLAGILLAYLNGRPDVSVHGLRDADRSRRVPTISFTVEGWSSRALVEHLEKSQKGSRLGVRWGHFYSYRLVGPQVLGLLEKVEEKEVADDKKGVEEGSVRVGEKGKKDGVVRVSLVHYNTVEEVQLLVAALKEVLGE